MSEFDEDVVRRIGYRADAAERYQRVAQSKAQFHPSFVENKLEAIRAGRYAIACAKSVCKYLDEEGFEDFIGMREKKE